MPNEHHTIIILNDGDTWSTINQCSVVVITDAQFQDLCNDRCDVKDLTPVAEIALLDATPSTESV